MTTETVLTPDQILALFKSVPQELPINEGWVARQRIAYGLAIEQAVLQSPEVQALRKDAERYRWATVLDDNAETLYSIVLSYGGDQAKINERVDAYRPDAAIKEQP